MCVSVAGGVPDASETGAWLFRGVITRIILI
jgi:hypothetical protein